MGGNIYAQSFSEIRKSKFVKSVFSHLSTFQKHKGKYLQKVLYYHLIKKDKLN